MSAAPDETPDILSAALAYASMGWPIFPTSGKRPANFIRHWSQEATTDPATIAAWYAGTSGLGIGVHLGLAGLVVIDVDHREHLPSEIQDHLDQSRAWVHRGNPERASWVFQGQGVPQSSHAWGEVKASGGYIVLAPSPHPDGWTYEWVAQGGPLPGLLPGALVPLVAPRTSQEGSREPWTGEEVTQAHLNAAEALRGRLVARLAAMEPETGRNNALRDAALVLGHYVGHILDQTETQGMLLEACQANGLVKDTTLREVKATLSGSLQAGMRQPQLPRVGLQDPPLFGGEWAFPTGSASLPEDDDPALGADLTTLGLVDWSALFSGEEEEREFLIPGVLPCGLVATLYSAPEAGKSLLALDWAAALASGGEILGETVEPRVVLYIDHEQDRTTLRERLEAMGYEDGDRLANLHYSLHGDWPQLDTWEGGQRLLAVAQALGADLVIIDTTSRVITGSENDSDTFMAFYRNTVARLKGAGIASLRLDHTGKDPERGERGSSAKRGDIDLAYHLVKDDDDRVTLVREKNRTNLDGPKRLALRRDQFPALRHVLAEPGEAVDEAVAQLVKDMDFMKIPLDWGRSKVRARFAALGRPVRNGTLAKAIAIRKARGPLI